MARDRLQCGGLEGYDLGAPPTWGALPLEPVDGADPGEARRDIAALAADLTADADAAATCEQHLMLAQPAFVADGPLAACVWVPDATDGIPRGVLKVTQLVGDESGEATPDVLLDALQANAPQPGEVRRHVEEVDVPCGKAVVLHAFGADGTGELEESVTYFVFPDNCRDAVELAFATGDLNLSAELIEDARVIVDTLTVTARTA